MSLDTANAIGNTVTDEDVNLVARRYANDEKARVLSYHIDDFSEKLGLLGSHRHLNITFQRSKASKPETADFFVKSMPYDCKEQADFMSTDGIFDKEANFLNTIATLMDKHCKCEKWHAICYLAKKDAMIMENLRSQGFATVPKTFDDEVTLKSILGTLARFHSSSILVEHHLNLDSKRPLTLKERYPGHLDELLFARDVKFYAWINAGANAICSLAKNLGYDPDKVRKTHDEVYRVVRPSKTHRNVISHGDLHEKNIMFADDNDDDSTTKLHKCLLVDFQLVRYAPLVLDLLHVIHLKATRAYRERHERDLLEYYHSVMKRTIESNDSLGDVKVPTLQEIIAAMDDLRVFGLVVAVQYFPLTLMDMEIAVEHVKDSDSYNYFLFVDRTQAIADHMGVNEFYRKHVEAAVIELAEKSQLLYP